MVTPQFGWRSGWKTRRCPGGRPKEATACELLESLLRSLFFYFSSLPKYAAHVVPYRIGNINITTAATMEAELLIRASKKLYLLPSYWLTLITITLAIESVNVFPISFAACPAAAAL